MPRTADKMHKDNPMIEGIKYGLRQPTAEALSSSNLHLISTWIESCQNGHTLCRLGEDTPTLPTRVVDVGQADDSTEPSLFVSNGTSGIYVALSHCWGKAQPSMPQLKLTSLNIENMTSIIPIQSMPANFRDAVICTRTLGIRYLWIDSLCILQDSAADWEHESANMDGVYRDAILTIAAYATLCLVMAVSATYLFSRTSATSSHDGFLHRQISNPAFSVRFPPIGHMPSINLVLSLDDDGSSGYWEQDVNNSQWNARAWTMQLSLDYNTCTFVRGAYSAILITCIGRESCPDVSSTSAVQRYILNVLPGLNPKKTNRHGVESHYIPPPQR